MKKLFMFIFAVSLCFSINSVTLADLDYDEQIIVKDFVISLDDEITMANVELLEGIEYEIVHKDSGFIIIEKDGYYYIIPKE